MTDDVVAVSCICGQPLHVGLLAGPTFDQHADRRGPGRSCRLVLLPDPVSASVSIVRLGPGDSAATELRLHRGRWLERRPGWLR